MIKAYVENGRLMALSIALILVAGLGALNTLPRDEDPRISNRFALIITPFPGASAERVEALLTEPLENKLRELAEIKHIISNSRPGISAIRIELKDEVHNGQTDMIWSRARNLLDEIEADLPTGSLKPDFDINRTYAFTMIVAIEWLGKNTPPLAILGRYADELESKLRSLPGTDFVSLFGNVPEEILVTVDPNKANSAGLDIAYISSTIRGADAKIAAGQLSNDKYRFSVEVAGELDSVSRIADIPLVNNQQQEIIRVADVAKVTRALQSPADDLAVINGQPSVVVAARMLAKVRNDQWTASVEQTLSEFNSNIPANIQAKILFSQNDYTQDRLSSLIGNIVLGFCLIVIVLLLTLGWRSALIVAASLPLTVLFTLTCMQYYGLPIHQMSVTGLIVALGIMVDNAIVMTDTIAHNRSLGMDRITAASRAVRHLWLPLMGSTITTILGFLPIVLMPGPAGEFVGGIALSVIFSLVGSYLISHTIIAGLAGRFVKTSPEKSSHWYLNGWQSERLSNRFRSLLNISLHKPIATVFIVLMLPLTGFICSQQLTEQFFPPSDRDMFNIELHLPHHSSIEATREKTHQISRILKSHAGVSDVQWFIGKSAPSFYYNLRQNSDGSPNFAQAMVSTEHFNTANQLIPQLQYQLDDQFPEAQILVRKLEQGPPFNAPIELRVYGPNLDTLSALGDEIRRVMLATQDVIHTRATLSDATPKIWLHVDENLSKLSGLSLQQLAMQTRNSLDGSVQSTVLETTQELPVRVRIHQGARDSINDIGNLYYQSLKQSTQLDEHGLPLSSLGDLQLHPSRGEIPHRDGQRLNTLEAYIRANVLPAAVLERVKYNLEKENFQLPSGYHLEFGGEGEKRNNAIGNLLAYVGVIVTLLVLVIVLNFNSFRLGMIIFAVAFQAAGLGLLSVFVFQYPFGFTVIISLLGLMGLAINAAIVIIAELKSNARAVTGDAHAIMTCVMNCSRHITSTTITTTGGFLPLILAGGGFWPPFAVSIAGGTLLATLLSFFFVPALFCWFARRRAFELNIDGIKLSRTTQTQQTVDLSANNT